MYLCESRNLFPYCNHRCYSGRPVSHRCDACGRYFALCFCLPTWWERALFFAISHAAFGIINLQVFIGPPLQLLLTHMAACHNDIRGPGL